MGVRDQGRSPAPSAGAASWAGTGQSPSPSPFSVEDVFEEARGRNLGNDEHSFAGATGLSPNRFHGDSISPPHATSSWRGRSLCFPCLAPWSRCGPFEEEMGTRNRVSLSSVPLSAPDARGRAASFSPAIGPANRDAAVAAERRPANRDAPVAAKRHLGSRAVPAVVGRRQTNCGALSVVERRQESHSSVAMTTGPFAFARRPLSLLLNGSLGILENHHSWLPGVSIFGCS